VSYFTTVLSSSFYRRFLSHDALLPVARTTTNNNNTRTCNGSAADCRTPAAPAPTLEVRAISLRPRAFLIENFFTAFEAAEVIQLGAPRVGDSVVGDVETGSFQSTTRTSKNGWISRTCGSDVIEALYARAEDLLQIPTLDARNTEEIQVCRL
jgi:hypothetical protein